MQAARIRTTLAALTVGAGLVLGGAGVAQAAPLTQPGPVTGAPSAAAVSTPITGSFTDASGGTGTFAGTFTPTQFLNQDGQLAVVGTVTGTLTDSAGNVVGTPTQQVTAPVHATATCDILNLDLGPLDLDLLGLQVHLDRVVLDIVAEQGPGNLLGNLLCAVAGLLDNPGGGGLDAIIALLNQILSILR